MVQAQSCEVQIVGAPIKMYAGQFAHLVGNVTGATALNYSWAVEGPIIKDYDDNVYNSTYLTASLNIDPPTYMTAEDFRKGDISFYWQPNISDTIRTVSLKVTTSDTSCETSSNFEVVKNNDNINLQAEDFYVEKNHPVRLNDNGGNTTRVLQQHQQWHNDFYALNQSYSKKGSLFFDFHRIYLAHFDAWRHLFGYPAIIAWDPATPVPVGIDINHDRRSINFTNPYRPLELPSWFKYQPGSEGPQKRNISFVRSFEGQNELPPGHPLLGSGLQIDFIGPIDPKDPVLGRFAFLNGHTVPMCEEMDYPSSSSGYPLSQDSLLDFEPDQVLLGCALTDPYHDDRHGEIGGDMQRTSRSPEDPIFWRLHKYIDGVSVQRFFPPFSSLLASTVQSDLIAPQVISQNPFRLYPYITTLPVISEKEGGLFGMVGTPALSAQFNEPVIGVKASDFTVNGVQATQVQGAGTGPYVFVGFKPPEYGPVNVTLSSGNITDIAGNHFEGAAWEYVLVNPDTDNDNDGLKDELEVNMIRTSPELSDSDGDSIPDGIESTSTCLNPLVNDNNILGMQMHVFKTMNSSSMNESHIVGLDSDRDNKTNVQEFINKTNPCSMHDTPTTELRSHNITNLLSDNITISRNTSKGLTNNADLQLIFRWQDGLTGKTNHLIYNSNNRVASMLLNGTSSIKKISGADDLLLREVLIGSGLFNSQNLYTSETKASNALGYSAVVTTDGNSQFVSWTSNSEGVPQGIKNLPFIVSFILSR
jgi:hypothetical protein